MKTLPSFCIFIAFTICAQMLHLLYSLYKEIFLDRCQRGDKMATAPVNCKFTDKMAATYNQAAHYTTA